MNKSRYSTCLLFSLLCASMAFGLAACTQIDPPPASVAQGQAFGITPDKPTSLQTGIEEAYRAGFKKVILPPGVYRIPRPANPPWHLKFSDMKNFEIEATGVTLVFEGRDRRAMLFDYCQNVTFRGATLLRDIPPFSQGKVTAIAEDRGSVDVRVDTGYPADLDDKRYFPHIPVVNAYEKGTRKIKPLVPDIYLSRVERLGGDLFRFYARSKIDSRIPLEIGDPLAWRGTSGSDLNTWSSSGMRMENITIKNGTGIGFMEICGDGGNVYSGCTITYADTPPGATEAPLLACATDGFHSASARKGPRLENCFFEGLNDDQVNIHGTYAMLMETQGTSAIIDWRTPHTGSRQPFLFVRPGDPIRFYDLHGALTGEAVAVSIRARPDYDPGDLGMINSRRFSDRKAAVYYEVVLDHPVPAPRTGLVANPNTTGSGFVIRNSTFRNNRAHGIFIRASDGLIENNTIEGSMMAGIVIAPEMNSWNESDYARNIIIRGNTLRDVGVATQPWNSGITVAGFEYGGFAPLPGGHRNIVIRDNTLENVRGANIVLTSTIGAEIRDNHFIRPMSAPAFRVENYGINNDRALIWLRQADGVKLEGNTVTAPGPHFGQLVDADATVTASGLTGGVTLTPTK